MAKVLINSPLYSFYTSDYIEAIQKVPAGEDLTMYLNTPGGSVLYSWGIFQAMAEHEGKVNLKISGHSMSMGVLFPLFADYTEALDITTFMIHRADMYIEDDEDQALLDKYNKDLYSKLDAKIDSDELKKISGFTLKEIFESSKREEVFLTAKEAKKIGLIDKVVKLERKSQAAAFFGGEVTAEFIEKEINGSHNDPHNNNQINNSMTLQEFMTKHPLIYAEAVALGRKEGVTAEKDRVGAWAVFMDVDPEAVAKGIDSDKEISTKEMAMFTRAAGAAEFKKGLSGEDDPLPTGEDDKKTAEAKAKEKADAEFEKELNIELEIKNKED